MAETTTKKRTYTKKTTPTKPKAEVAAPAPAEDVMEYPQVEGVTPTVVNPQAAPQINMVVEQKAPPVKIIYIDSVIPNNEIPIGGGRKITGSGRVFSVPMELFEGEFMTPLVMQLIDERKFIILDGLNDEQRQQYNCAYSEGEVVRDEGMFDYLFEMDAGKAAIIFSMLCPQHQQLVATRFMTAYYEKHDNRITRDKVEALNKASKVTDPDGLFTPIVKDFNEKNT